MKIAVDLTSLSYHLSGIERYALCMTQEMLENDTLNEYVLIFRNTIYKDFIEYIDGSKVQAVILTGNNKLLFYQITITKCLYKLKADCYIFFAFTSPLLFLQHGIINTLHDMGSWDCSETQKFLHKVYFRLSCRIAVRVAKKIITVSNFSKERIKQVLNISESKILVLPSAPSKIFSEPSTVLFSNVQKKYGIPDKYIMSLSTLEPRKNLKLLLESYSEIESKVSYDLVLVGRMGWKEDSNLNKYLSDTRIHFTGFVEDKDVKEIYKNTLCFVFPSKYEGFGLPPLEALKMGAPVISSDAASMPEVLMEQATYFKNDSKVELKQLLIKLEDNYHNMKRGLNEYQITNFNFKHSAVLLLEYLNNMNSN